MTYAEVNTLIGSFGLPYEYFQFPEGTGQQCPFICFYFTGNADLGADNTNYSLIRNLVIELYTDNKDFDLEKRIEEALNAAGFYYSSAETYISSEKMYMVTYSMQVNILEEE
jgi:hypothetical protein